MEDGDRLKLNGTRAWSLRCWKQNVTSFFATVNPELKYVSHDEEGRGRQAFHNCAGSEVFSAFSDEKEQRTEASQEKVEIRHMKKFKDVSGPEGLFTCIRSECSTWLRGVSRGYF